MQLNSRENILIAWIKWLNLRKNVLQHQSFSLASTKGTYKKNQYYAPLLKVCLNRTLELAFIESTEVKTLTNTSP